MDFQKYPMDVQTLRIQIAACMSLNSNEVFVNVYLMQNFCTSKGKLQFNDVLILMR